MQAKREAEAAKDEPEVETSGPADILAAEEEEDVIF